MMARRLPQLAILAGLALVVALRDMYAGRPPAPAATAQVSGAATAARAKAGASFPLGVVEDGNLVGEAQQFAAMLRDLQAHGLDSLMFTNNRVAVHAPLLAVSDRLGVGVYLMQAWDLDRAWWPAEIPATIERAREVAAPVVAAFGPHPSAHGYIVKDEPAQSDAPKVALLTQALEELDPGRRAAPILIGVGRAEPIFAAAQPDTMLINVYPAGHRNPPCDFTMTGYGYRTYDFVSYTRAVTRGRPADVPLWMILQTHSFGDGTAFALRAPQPSEVRMQHWLALGEGATGIFWFIYSSQQGWVGLADSPALFGEVAAQARRTAPLRELLVRLRKVEDRFEAAGAAQPYVSTLADPQTGQSYAVVVNRDCQRTQPITIGSATLHGALWDVETGEIHPLGTPVTLAPGDGRIFQHIRSAFLPLVQTSAGLNEHKRRAWEGAAPRSLP